jgi:type IV pilus assembly protein PilV
MATCLPGWPQKCGKQKGVSLVEILITIVILGIGFIGISGLQLAGLKYSYGAHTRTQASLLTNDILDRMRANRARALNTSDYLFDFTDSIPTITANCTTSPCTTAQMASYDRAQWLTNVKTILPNGTAEITAITTAAVATGTERTFQVTLRWKQSNTSEDIADEDEFLTFVYRGGI